jgi:hypothetical protein
MMTKARWLILFDTPYKQTIIIPQTKIPRKGVSEKFRSQNWRMGISVVIV